MQILRTIIWVLLLVALLLFSIANWDPTVTVRIWQDLVVDTKIPAIVVVSFLIGFLPMWLYNRANSWRLHRKIASLENAARTVAATPIASADVETEEPVFIRPEHEPVATSDVETDAATSSADGSDLFTADEEPKPSSDDEESPPKP